MVFFCILIILKQCADKHNNAHVLVDCSCTAEY